MKARAAKLLLGPALALTVWLLPAIGMPEAAWRTLGLAAWMVAWWILEPVPLAATALLPIVFLPVLGLGDFVQATAPFAHPVVFLFLGGFLLAAAMQRWRLHERVALLTVLRVGARPATAVGGFMLATAAVSMWVSNTAAAIMMLPMAISVAQWTTDAGTRQRLGAALVLAIAYGATIGGLGTLIGTPPNAFMAGFVGSEYGLDVGFARWFLSALPLVLVGLAATWWVLVRMYRLRGEPEIEGGVDGMRERLRLLGPLSVPERRVAAVFAVAIAGWLARPFLPAGLPVDDTGIAIGAALLLFVVPSGQARPVLTWNEARGIPWEILLLFGGGLSLAGAMVRSGLADWIGSRIALLDAPDIVLIAAFAIVVLLLTELASNTAIAAALLPVAAAVAIARGDDPRLLAVPVALAASAAFMLPVATPPNAVAYGSGLLTIRQMARTGIWLNLVFLALVTLHSAFVAPAVLGY